MADFDMMPDSTALDDERRTAGQAYLERLRALGMHPYTALWAYDTEAEEFRLVIFSDLVGFKGPERIYALLHKAYNEAKLPKEIDPWIVELIDTSHPIRDVVRHRLANIHTPIMISGRNAEGEVVNLAPPDPNATTTTFDEFVICRGWVYFEDRKPRFQTPQQQWKRFETNVGPIAA